ncbi:MAG: hypothetical protein ACI8ZB_001097 [Desulforhopalus sp.]
MIQTVQGKVFMCVAETKYLKLKEILLGHKRTAVAFSGGIDSTFLLYAAIDTLGSENVLAYNCVSVVNSAQSIANMRSVFHRHFQDAITLNEIGIYLLTWKEFIINNEKRCYFCKKRMYSTLLDELRKENGFVLTDGTNVDDLKKNRPGLRAIRELNVHTPLVEAGLTKQEIRNLAKNKGLVNFALPSNSCLATRVKQGVDITSKQLVTIEKSEDYLQQLGFKGCRVKIDGDIAFVELTRGDCVAFVKDDVRAAIQHRFYSLGFKKIFLDLTER